MDNIIVAATASRSFDSIERAKLWKRAQRYDLVNASSTSDSRAYAMIALADIRK